jgi:capsular polysaccharide transport system permease protein
MTDSTDTTKAAAPQAAQKKAPAAEQKQKAAASNASMPQAGAGKPVAKSGAGQQGQRPVPANAGRNQVAAGRPGAGDVARRAPRRPAAARIEARLRLRHIFVIVSFFLLVVFPSIYANWYLHTKAADQYATQLAFTIQSNDAPQVSSIIDVFTGGAGSTADDAQILSGFIESQNLVQTLDAKLDLRAIYNKAPGDWYFSLGEDRSIEELVDYWHSMVLVAFDAGIVEVEVRAFEPLDAQIIAAAVLEESTKLINRLSNEAREDALRDARDYLAETRQRLRDVRLLIGELRSKDQIVDPTIDVTAAMSRVSELQAILTEEQLRLDQLQEFAAAGDSRIVVAERRIRSLETLIVEERSKIASDGTGGDTLSTSVGRFEELAVDRELAEQGYAIALASYENAKAEARRQQRYLTAHIAPTLSQEAQYPERYILGGILIAFLFMGWVVLVMIAYNIKDRR